MLTPQEKIRLIELQEKEKKSYTPLSDQELKEHQDRAISRTGAALGHLNGFTTLMSSIGEYTDKVAKDNIRLLQEIYYLRSQWFRFEQVNQLITLMLNDKTTSVEEKRNDLKALIGEIEAAISILVFDEAAEQSVQRTADNVAQNDPFKTVSISGKPKRGNRRR